MGWHPGAGVGANLDGESMSQGFEKGLVIFNKIGTSTHDPWVVKA